LKQQEAKVIPDKECLYMNAENKDSQENESQYKRGCIKDKQLLRQQI
jgi:hypothetical protein